MENTRIKFSTVLEKFLPNYVKDSYPLVAEFLKEYYKSLETRGSTLDILQNIDKYIKIDNITNLNEDITLTETIRIIDNSIRINNGFKLPDSYGLIQIDDEIILYKSKTFVGGENGNEFILNSCVRGFSGITNYQPDSETDHLEFSESNVSSHTQGSSVKNLSNLILSEFFIKVKKQFAPGFENEQFYPQLNQNLFVKQIRDFYRSKGTDESFRILFKALYGENVEVIKPQDYLFIPSNAEYRVSENIVVEKIKGNILSLEGRTIYQKQSQVASIARATVNKVQLIQRSGKDYYVLSLDFDYDKDINLRGSVFGTFKIGPKTTLTEDVNKGDYNLSVDSTVGFPNISTQNNLYVKLDNGAIYRFNYTSTTNNQFLDIENGVPASLKAGTEIYYDSFCYGGTKDENETEDQIEFRVTGVLKDIEIDKENFGMKVGNSLSLQTLGKVDNTNVLANNWVFNLPILYDVESIILSQQDVQSQSYTYTVNLYDKNILRTGDLVTIESSTPETFEVLNPITVKSEYSFSFSIDKRLNENLTYKVKRKINKFKYTLNSSENNNPDTVQYHSDVSNVYYGKNDGEIYVASPSLPNYNNNNINPKTFVISLKFNSFITEVDNELNSNIKDKVINFGSQNPHPFLTGDEVFYYGGEGTGLNLSENRSYFVEKVSDTQIKLANTRSNIFTKTFVDVDLKKVNDDSVFGDGHKFYKFGVGSFDRITSAQILRKIEPPKNDSNVYPTKSGTVGILVNGVEILNYKSEDYIYFNRINSVSLVSGGNDYDLLNPPKLSVIDSNGSGCEIYPEINGSLKEIRVIDGGFDYLNTPVIKISGGNGENAKAEPVMGRYEYIAKFDASEESGLINLTTGTIGFSTYHNFYDGEEVFYEVLDNSISINGLQNNSKYYVGKINDLNVRLYSSYSDSIAKINQVTFINYGFGQSSLRSVEEKNRIESITVVSTGLGYKNKKVLVDSSGISTYSNTIRCPDRHQYATNERIIYKPLGASVVGISTTTTYYVNVLDEFTFSLSQERIEDSKNVISVGISSVGIGTHIFEYEPIQVTIEGLDRINTSAQIQPIFAGPISQIYLYKNGTNYGTPNIINYKKEPECRILNGSGAQLSPIVVNGKIVNVIVNNPGENYYSIPEIIVDGKGKFAKLVPIIENNKLVEVVIENSGIGYDQNNTTLIVKSSGSNAQVSFELQSWNINLVERYLLSSNLSGEAQVLDDNDSFIVKTFDSLKYTHAYAPRKFRESLLTKRLQEDEYVYSSDLIKQSGIEIDSETHSPIIGWAYDGNPIYGPYGFENKDGSGRIVKMQSGYSKVSLENRPPLPDGIFVEDYAYFGAETSSGSQINSEIVLDENNGRFCVTPEFPDGVYAYFCTIGDVRIEFNNYKKPVFPYIIGNTYHSKPIEYNFKSDSYENLTNLNEKNWIRNTYPYNLLNNKSEYKFLSNISKKGNLSKISSILKGSIDEIEIFSGGNGYKVNDKVFFENEGTGGSACNAIVEEIKGKNIIELKLDSSLNVSNLDFSFIPNPNGNGFIGFTTTPHNILDGVTVSLFGIKGYAQDTNSDLAFKDVNVVRNSLILLSDVDTLANTGSVTYFTVSGNLSYPRIKENDVYIINDLEKIKILRVEPELSRIWVIRNYESSGGGSEVYPSGTIIFELPAKFEFNASVDKNKDYSVSRDYYFNPNESLGIGLTSGVQYGKTVVFSNPGVGATQVFIQSQRIYLPNHGIKNNTKLIYSSEEFTPVSISTNGTTFSQLTNGSSVYSKVFDSNFIGISTLPVGISTTNGQYVDGHGSGLLYFSETGTGSYHKFRSSYSTNNNGKLTTNVATALLEEEHELNVGDSVRIDVVSGISTSVKVFYNKENRRIVFDKKEYLSSDVSIQNNTIFIKNHGYYSGQKVIYQSSNSGTLQNNKIYYIIVIDQDTIKVSSSYQDAISKTSVGIDLSTAVAGSFSAINPGLKYIRNQKITFDLSDSSLSFSRNNQIYSSFKLNFYKNSQFTDLFEDTSSTSKSIIKTGAIGITSTAKIDLIIDDNIPNVLYYKFNLDNTKFNPTNILIDNEVEEFNSISLLQSQYNKNHTIIGVTSTSFDISLFQKPEVSSYTQTNSVLNYYTNSYSGKGEISKIKILDGGRGYRTLPGISSIASTSPLEVPGSKAIVFAKSKTVGRVKKVDFENIGSDYYCDLTLRPTAKLPEIIKVEPFASFKSIQIISSGKNYQVAPSLVVLDGFTNIVEPTIKLEYELNDKFVSIVKNSRGLYNQIPTIIPVNNSNGISIREISYDSINKKATVFLRTGFSLNSNPFPFEVGDKVLLENISVGIGTVNILGEYSFVPTGTGYNSEDYNYHLFTITSVDENYGGTGSVVIDMSDALESGKSPGAFNEDLSESAIIVAEKYFPVFDIELEKNSYIVGETVKTPSATGIVENWDPTNELITVLTKDTFKKGEIVFGNSSYSTAKIANVSTFNANYVVSGSAVRNEGWNTESGFLNNSIQRLHDNDYYQYFSYSLKSKKSYSEWENSVSSLNHISGYKKFSDLIVESPINLDEIKLIGIGKTIAALSDVSVVTDFIELADFNCYNYFDLASENSYYIGNSLVSDQIVFNTKEIQDYTESISNRVLLIDDISSQFNNVPRSENYVSVDSFKVSDTKYKKYFTFIKDKTIVSDRQFSIVSLIYDDTSGYINQYGKVNTSYDMGDFDFFIYGSEGNLQFYPTNFSQNDYSVSAISFDISSVSGISTYNIGNLTSIVSTQSQILAGVGTTTVSLVGIASTYRAAKLLVSANTADGSYYEIDEVTVLRNNSNDLYILEYGQLSNDSTNALSASGIGTFNAYYDNSTSKIIVDLTTNTSLASTVYFNTSLVSIAASSTTSSEVLLDNSKVYNSFVAISSSPSPGISTIATQSSDYSAGYYIVSISDTTNDKHQVSEVALVSYGTSCYTTEFGIVETSENLCSFGCTVSGSNLNLQITPIANTSLDVRVFAIGLKVDDNVVDTDSIEIGSTVLQTKNANYLATEKDVKKDFELTHKNNPIFEKTFNSESSLIVDIQENQFNLSNHYFVTGEEISYDYSNGSPIGIATTTVPGIGSTDKLPEKLFVVKIDDKAIKVATSATDSLSFNPVVLSINTLGVGTAHKFISKNQNNKSLISIDNIVQSPIVSTAVTTLISTNINLNDTKIEVQEANKFASGDFIKIDNEIFKINTVGFGSTNSILVERNLLGSNISTHSSGAVVSKISGNYNIVDNRIFFSEAPFGETPNSSPNGDDPDELDWSGITTNSSFHGRIFLRSASIGSTEETYSKNYIFDDISNDFTGIRTGFTLKVDGVNATGINTSNVIVLVKDIVQIPQKTEIFDPKGNYKIVGTSQTTSIIFNKSASGSDLDDINSANNPVGGVIVSVSSKGGLGYQPLVSAGATPVISAAGTIQSLSIGSTGSGYRKLSSYQVITETSENISVGSTQIKIVNVQSVIQKLPYTSSNTVSVGSSIKDATIVGYTTNSILIGTGSTLNSSILSATTVKITLNNPTSALIDIGISTISSEGNITHLGFTTSNSGYISTNVQITNVGAGYTEYNLKHQTTTSSVVSIGSTNIPLTEINNVDIGDYITVGSALTSVQIVGIASTSILISTASTLPYTISSGTTSLIKEFNPPIITFEQPLSYSNLPLKYSSISQSGIGTNASVNIIVGQDSKIIDFDIKNSGYGYKKGDILTISTDTNDLLGISTNTSVSFSEFQLTVDQTYQDKFSAWSLGDMTIIDSFDSLFDGQRKEFPIKINGEIKSIRSRKGSNIDIQATLIVFVNEIIQIPGISYTFEGGSIIRFIEAPKLGDRAHLLFYTGTSSIDTAEIDILETIKVGDDLVLKGNSNIQDQKERTVNSIVSSDRLKTNVYNGVGISSTLVRSVTWCKQTEDRIIDGQKVGKSRESYEPNIVQSTKLIGNVGVNSTEMFVESVSTLFNYQSENTTSIYKNKIKIISEDVLTGAAATCTVSYAGTITSFNISESGVGYSTEPQVFVQNPVGYGTTARAIGQATISDGKVTSISISNPGFGYTVGPISKITLISNGSGYPSGLTTSKQNNIYYKAKVKSFNGNGKEATVNIGVEGLGINYFQVVDGGNGYSIGDRIYVDNFDNQNLRDSDRNTLLTNNIVFEVTQINPPLVFISPPQPTVEVISNVTYEGDYGDIVGMGTTGSNFYMDLHIPYDSYMRNSSVVGSARTISGIQTGYYMVVRNSNLGSGSISLKNDNSVIGIGTTCFDNIYQVFSTQVFQTDIAGVGVTYVKRVITKVQDTSTVGFPTSIESFDSSNITFDSNAFTFDSSSFGSRTYGKYSWGRISIPERKDPLSFTARTYTSTSGLTTSPTVERFNPLKYINYT